MKKRALSKRTSPAWQDGQALVFALVFTAAAGLIGLLLFNSGMLANTKTRLQNAADAAAYSAGVLQARDHNFSAYTNRAMVANQAAVAQIVSIKSYLEDAADTVDRMDGPLLSMQRELYPSWAPVWDSAKLGVGPVVSTANTAFSKVAPTIVQMLDRLIKVHETAQTLHHVATVTDMLSVTEDVIKRNDPQAKLSSGVFAAGNLVAKINAWAGSTTRHRANDSSAEADRFADVVVSRETTDAFSRNRLSSPIPRWASTVKPTTCPPTGLLLSFTTFNFVHAGGTILSSDKKRWEALDATQGDGGWVCVYSCPIFVTCPIGGSLNDLGGSGGGVVGTNGGYTASTGYKNNPSDALHYGWALFSPAAAPAAYRYAVKGPGASLDSAGGLQDYYRDMANPTKDAPSNQSMDKNGGAFPITLEAERQASTIRTSSKFLSESSVIRVDDNLAGGTMRAMASAHAYFYRSTTNKGFTFENWKRSDGRKEVANLFSPYWQARLVDRSDVERAASVAEQMR